MEGPILEALDLFIAEAMRELAGSINDRRRRELDQQALDEMHAENRVLNDFKNRFLPGNGAGNNGASRHNGNGNGSSIGVAKDDSQRHGVEPHAVELAWRPATKLRVGRGVNLLADPI